MLNLFECVIFCHKAVSYISFPFSPLSNLSHFCCSTTKVHRLSKLCPVKCFVSQVVYDPKCWQLQKMTIFKKVTGFLCGVLPQHLACSHAVQSICWCAKTVGCIQEEEIFGRHTNKLSATKGRECPECNFSLTLPICTENNKLFFLINKKRVCHQIRKERLI